jgi:hypothetical protein
VWPIGEQALAAGEGGLKNLKTAITTLLQVGMKIRKKVWPQNETIAGKSKKTFCRKTSKEDSLFFTE